jgi:L-lactate dehydrogenase complex protein LldG
MSSKELILEKVKKRKPALSSLPKIPLFERSDVDLITHFKEMLQLAGGQVILCNNSHDLIVCLSDIYAKENIIWSNFTGIKSQNIESDSVVDPHELRGIDLAILKGDFGVAENAAIWISERSLPYRVLPFITQHLVLLLDKTALIWNMHQAYQMFDVLKIDDGFGVFISGPSKTADIEQSLVIGAHGAKSLTVIFTNDLENQ